MLDFARLGSLGYCLRQSRRKRKALPMFTYTATAPNGQILTKTSKRIYSHAVIALGRSGAWLIYHVSATEQGALNLASRYDIPMYVVPLTNA